MTLRDLLHKKKEFHRARNPHSLKGFDSDLYAEKYFNHSLHVEKRRAERSRKRFMLMLLDVSALPRERGERAKVAQRLTTHLFSLTRETDIKGWYRYDSVIGTIFTEMGETGMDPAALKVDLCNKLRMNLDHLLPADQLARVAVSWYVFPDELDHPIDNGSHSHGSGGESISLSEKPGTKLDLAIKRMIDVTGSIFGLLLTAPVFIVVAALVKLSSEGPVFFRQERVGLSGKTFTFLKFRSMYVGNNPALHQKYIREFMAAAKENKNSIAGAVYKITHDPRVTPVGRFFRKTSIDELPQLINVLRGEMSLVGPRPPIPYECERYDVWHRRRVLEVKPGITGLWQISGRSATTFDDMVRMDIKYTREWSIWLDLKILIKTPLAVFSCKGAY